MRSQLPTLDNDPLIVATARLRIAGMIICAVRSGELDTESLGSAAHMARTALAILEPA